jgi:hypothetical protein
MFENLSRAMRGNKNAQKKLGLQAIGGAVGGAVAGGLSRVVAKGALVQAKASRKLSLNTIVPKILATEALNTAISKAKDTKFLLEQARNLKVLNAATRAEYIRVKTNDVIRSTVNVKNATRALYQAHDIRPNAIKAAKASLAVAKAANKYSKAAVAAGALIGINAATKKEK